MASICIIVGAAMIGGTAGAGGCFAVDSVVGGAVVVEVSAGGAGGAGGCGVGVWEKVGILQETTREAV